MLIKAFKHKNVQKIIFEYKSPCHIHLICNFPFGTPTQTRNTDCGPVWKWCSYHIRTEETLFLAVIMSLGDMFHCKTVVAHVEIKDVCTTLWCLLIADQLCATVSVYTITAALSSWPRMATTLHFFSCIRSLPDHLSSNKLFLDMFLLLVTLSITWSTRCLFLFTLFFIFFFDQKCPCHFQCFSGLVSVL